MSSEKMLETYLLQHIPISKAMGVEVKSVSPQKVVLKAPFINNINHKQTVFGGSLHAVSTLACWSLLHLHLKENNIQIVIAKSEVDYLSPVAADFEAECSMPDVLDWDKFLKMFKKNDKARIKLHAQIVQGTKLCVKFTGIFVAIRS